MAGPIYFAIGDVHGEADRLREMHRVILERIAEEGRMARIVHLGDYVDRGPDSKGVIETIMALQATYDRAPTIEVLALMGNHEEMMLSQVAGATSHWLGQGGEETLKSYGIDVREHPKDWADRIPRDHMAWLLKLPTLYYDEPRRLAFVHAGIDPSNFPDDRPEVHLWTRARSFFEHGRWPQRPELDGLMVVHGHTPQDDLQPELFPHRINVDTGAVYGGALTAVMLKEGAEPELLQVEP